MSTVKVNKRGANRVRHGHLWIYRSDVIVVDGDGGSIVSVLDESGNFVGQAFYSDKSEIALRFLTLTKETIDDGWWHDKIRQSCERRNIPSDTNAYRVVYSEGDLLPSLIVDRYADVIVLQTLSQGTDRIKSTLLDILIDQFQPRAVIERNDARVRQLEGLPLTSGTIYGTTPDQFEILQHGLRFLVSPSGGQKTGSFLDQRENRLAARDAARVSAGLRALDCFTFNGGFALHVAGVCKEVIAIDISDQAIEAARQNAELNHIQNVEFQVANVFDALRDLEASGER